MLPINVFKKFILGFFVLCASAQFSNAERRDSLNPSVSNVKRFYYQIGTGYLFNSGTDNLEQYIQKNTQTYTVENVKSSWGKGFDVGLTFGGKFNSSLGVEIEFGYTVGGKNKTNSEYYVAAVTSPLVVKEVLSTRANTFRINPKLVFEMPFKKTNALYGKLGYMVGAGKAIVEVQEEWIFDNGGYGAASYQRDNSGGSVSGATMALGIRIQAEKDLSFFVEVVGNSLHRKFEKNVMTKYMANGQDLLGDLSYFQKQTNFVDKATYNLGVIDEDKPREIPSFLSNYSSAGIRLGFIINF
jgi:hypothetical protein